MINTFPEPCWGVSQDACETGGAFAKGGPNPFILSGVFQRLLQYHFSTPDNIDEPLLKEYIWTPSSQCCKVVEDSEDDGTSQMIPPSRILIRPSWSQLGPDVQQLPTLLVKREAFRSERIAFQDASLTGRNAKGVYEGRQHLVNIVGKHSIICKGGTGAEAELLGQEVFFRMLHYQQIIKRDFQLGHLFTQGVSDVKDKKNEAKPTFYTVVSIEWAYVYLWLIIPESPIVKRIAFEYREA